MLIQVHVATYSKQKGAQFETILRFFFLFSGFLFVLKAGWVHTSTNWHKSGPLMNWTIIRQVLQYLAALLTKLLRQSHANRNTYLHYSQLPNITTFSKAQVINSPGITD